MPDPFTSSLLAAEHRRCTAMLANSVEELDALLDPRLMFHHSNGAVDDKPTLMAKMAAGRIRYVAIDWSEEQAVQLADGAAVLGGRMLTVVSVEGLEKRLDNRVLQVWTQSEDDWRLVAFQSTPMPA